MDYSLFQALEKLLKPIRSRISNLIQRGMMHKLSESGVQVSLGEGDTQENIRYLQHYGFASHPPKNSETLLLFPSGERSTGFALSSNSPKGCPVQLDEGESAQYNEEGSSITLKNGGKLEIRNKENELISVLLDLTVQVEKLSQLSALAPPGGNYPGGNCTISVPGFDIASVKSKLSSFKA